MTDKHHYIETKQLRNKRWYVIRRKDVTGESKAVRELKLIEVRGKLVDEVDIFAEPRMSRKELKVK